MYSCDTRRTFIRRQNNSSNLHVYGTNNLQKYTFPQTYQGHDNRPNVTSITRLPLRSRSVMDKTFNSGKNSLKLKIGSISPWSDFSVNNSGKMRHYSVSLSKLRSANVKAEVLLKDPISKTHFNPINKSQCIFKFPKHRNNSSCIGNLKLSNENPIKSIKLSPTAKEYLIGKKRNEIKSHPTNNNNNNNNHSIFKFFKLKVNSYRDKIIQNQEVKQIDNVDKKSENKTLRKSSLGILENPKTKDFLLKLYNECKKLNGNIIKLYSDTNARHRGPIKNNSLWNSSCRNRNSSSDIRNMQRRSKSSVDINSKTSKDIGETLRESKKSESEFTSKNQNEGRYYHLACVLSPDIANTSTNFTKNLGKHKSVHILPPKPVEINKLLSEEITNISSVKSNVSTSSSTSSEINKANNFNKEVRLLKSNCPFINEFDDTLCDLDEDMNTDSSGVSNMDPNEIKSPISNSNYVTANDQNNPSGMKRHEEINRESLKVSSSLELPPIPSIKESELSDQSPRIDPPLYLNKKLEDDTKEICFKENQNVMNKFITVFEKQFPHRFILQHPSRKSENYKNEEKKDSSSKFTSTLTINCSKKLLDNGEDSKLFNPFKPPKCQSLKFNTLFNTNNNNSIEKEDIIEIERKNFKEDVKRLEYQNIIEIKIKNNNSSLGNPKIIVGPYKQIERIINFSQHSRIYNKVGFYQARTIFYNNIDKKSQNKIDQLQEERLKGIIVAFDVTSFLKDNQSEIQSLESFNSSRQMKDLYIDFFGDLSLFYKLYSYYKNKTYRKIITFTRKILSEKPSKKLLKTNQKNIKKKIIVNHHYCPTKIIEITENEASRLKMSKTLSVSVNLKEGPRKVFKGKPKYSSLSYFIILDIFLEMMKSLTNSKLSSCLSILLLKNVLKSYKRLQKKTCANRRISNFNLRKKPDTIGKIKKDDKELERSFEIKDVKIDFKVEEFVTSEKEKKFYKMRMESLFRALSVFYNKIAKKNLKAIVNNFQKYCDILLCCFQILIVNIPKKSINLSSPNFISDTEHCSLANVIGILLHEADILELNISDITKYFVYR